MNELKNITTLSKQDIKEVNKLFYLKTPLYLVLYAVCILSIISRLIDYFVFNTINLSATIPFLLALIAMFVVFVTNSKNMYEQSIDENKNPIEYRYTIDAKSIKLETSDGKKKCVELITIYKSFETKNCFVIKCRDGSLFIIKKDSFLEGSAEDFKKLI